ncbi:MAG: hypothetical protein AAF497_11180 [Planctomycetota bacterium]
MEKLLDYPRNPDVRANLQTWMQMRATLEKVYEPFVESVRTYLTIAYQENRTTKSGEFDQLIKYCEEQTCEIPGKIMPGTYINSQVLGMTPAATNR